MSCAGDCFIVLPPNCTDQTVIFGRNAISAADVGVAQEVYYYNATDALDGKCDGGAEPDVPAVATLSLILQKPKPGMWGADFGANERNVSIGITWSAETQTNTGKLMSTDIVRYALATAQNANEAVTRIGELVATHGSDDLKTNFIVCDTKEAWLVSCGMQLWAAQKLNKGYQRIPSDGLAVTTTIDSSTDNLGDALKTLGLWQGDGDIDFAACFNASPQEVAWSGPEPIGDGTYSILSMFETLRAAVDVETARSACVSLLSDTGITYHWFTATPNAVESVFKPFVFSPNPKISPLTMVRTDEDNTLLHKLHAQRKPAAIADLKALEAACVVEINTYIAEHDTADEELDELMKDCVEAEVKFYR